MTKRVLFFIFLALFLLVPTVSVQAAKKKPAPKKVVKTVKKAPVKTTSKKAAPKAAIKYAGYINPYLRDDKGAIIIAFSNLSKIKKITYELTYESNGNVEGVGGSVASGQGNYLMREIEFATCSTNTCVYHGSITNMKLTASILFKTGKTEHKQFRFTL